MKSGERSPQCRGAGLHRGGIRLASRRGRMHERSRQQVDLSLLEERRAGEILIDHQRRTLCVELGRQLGQPLERIPAEDDAARGVHKGESCERIGHAGSRQAPRKASRMRGLCRNSAAGPDSITLPTCRTYARSATSSALATFCSASSTAVPRPTIAAHACEHFGGEQRRKPERGFVEQEKARRAHQRAADREHLLLPARELPAERGGLFREHREKGVHRFHAFAGRAGRPGSRPRGFRARSCRETRAGPPGE